MRYQCLHGVNAGFELASLEALGEPWNCPITFQGRQRTCRILSFFCCTADKCTGSASGIRPRFLKNSPFLWKDPPGMSFSGSLAIDPLPCIAISGFRRAPCTCRTFTSLSLLLCELAVSCIQTPQAGDSEKCPSVLQRAQQVWYFSTSPHHVQACAGM